MHRFNIALLPVDESLQTTFAHYAQSHFGAQAHGYLLGRDALAHVTLCQFQADNEQIANHVFRSWGDSRRITLQFQNLQMREGRAGHAGKIWVEFAVRPTADLLEMQRDCHDHLQSYGCPVFTSVNHYSPHLTLARLPSKPTPLPDAPMFDSIVFYSALGLCNENGVFIKQV